METVSLGLDNFDVNGHPMSTEPVLSNIMTLMVFMGLEIHPASQVIAGTPTRISHTAVEDHKSFYAITHYR